MPYQVRHVLSPLPAFRRGASRARGKQPDKPRVEEKERRWGDEDDDTFGTVRRLGVWGYLFGWLD